MQALRASSLDLETNARAVSLSTASSSTSRPVAVSHGNGDRGHLNTKTDAVSITKPDAVSILASKRRMTEAFCNKASMLGAVGPQYGVLVFRGCSDVDLRSPEGKQQARENIRKGPFPVLWGSLVCTPWCHWMPLNLAKGTEALRERVSVDRAQSLGPCFLWGAGR